MARKPHKAMPAVSKASKKLAALGDRYAEAVRGHIEVGKSPAQAAELALDDVAWVKTTADIISTGAKESLKLAGVTAEGSFRRDVFLNRSFKGVTLSDRIVSDAVSGSKEVSKVISSTMEAGKSWSQLATNIRRTDLIGSDPTKRISELGDFARKAFAGNDPKALAAYQREIRRAEQYIKQLKVDNRSTGDLRRAYEKVIRATETGKQAAIDKAIDFAARKKMAYNAQRIARTETIRAYGDMVQDEFKNDEDVAAIQWSLTLGDNTCPVCEGIASEDSGYGAGVYLKDELPEYPAHPSCMCDLSPVYVDEINTK